MGVLKTSKRVLRDGIRYAFAFGAEEMTCSTGFNDAVH